MLRIGVVEVRRPQAAYAPPHYALRIGERSDAALRTAMGGRRIKTAVTAL
jgi:hypothetical protein